MGKTDDVDFVMVRVDKAILSQLKQIIPELDEIGAATLVKIILKKFVEEAKKRQSPQP